MVFVPRAYADNKSVLVRFKKSGLLPSNIITTIAELDSTLEANVKRMIAVMNDARHKSPEYYLGYHDTRSQYFSMIRFTYFTGFTHLEPKANAITASIRQELGLGRSSKPQN